MSLLNSHQQTRQKPLAWSTIGSLHRDERGVTATEYVVIAVLVACVIIFMVSVFGERIHNLYQQAVDTLHRDVRL